ncbi:MAG: ACP S-malonyltransferase [Caldimicrobium sp.]
MIALVFPGQGSQYLGMGKDFYENFSKAKEIFSYAETLTAIPIKKLVFEGPLEELTLTENLQVCLTVINICTYEVFKEAYQDKFFNKISFVAGHSLGEFSALYAASVLTLEETLLAVKKRGELMSKAGKEKPSGMYAIINFPIHRLEEILKEVPRLVIISNYNSPKQLVISGEEPELTLVAERAKKEGAKVVKLKVSAGFHSPLMSDAEKEFSDFLETLEFRSPLIPFVSNVSGKPEKDPLRIKELMKKQITSPVRWIEVIENIYSQGVSLFIELGPKQVLKGLISQILQDRPFKCYNVENMFTLEETLKEIS